MPRLPTPDSDEGQWGTILNEFLKVSHREDGSLKSTPIVFNVKDYGAVGDGVADDTTSIQNAIDAAFAISRTINETVRSRGALVFFPPGIYNHRGLTARAYVSLVGSGMFSSTLNYTLSSGNGITGGLDLVSFSMIELNFVSINNSTGWAVHFLEKAVRDLQIRRVNFANFLNGVFLGDSLNCSLSEVRISGQDSGPGNERRFPAGSIGLKLGRSPAVGDDVEIGGNGVGVSECYFSNFEHLIIASSQATTIIRPILEFGSIALVIGQNPVTLIMPWFGSAPGDIKQHDVDCRGSSGVLLVGYGSSSWKLNFANSSARNRSIIIPERLDRNESGKNEGIWFGRTHVYNKGDYNIVSLASGDKIEWRNSSGASGSGDVFLYRNTAGKLKTEGDFSIAGKLGVGNTRSATSLGRVVRKMEIFDENGNSMGFIPMYDIIA